jgi:chorismate mutase/prephenate dehydratase
MDPKSRLAQVREQMAELDRKLASALDERARLSKEVAGLAEQGAPVADLERDPLRWVDDLPESALPKESLRAIFAQVAAAARSLERPTRIAYLGAEGGFSHHMARAQFGVGSTFVECATVADVLEEVRRKRVAYGVFPFDSSVDGLIVPAVSALAETDLVLVAERIQPAVLCLMAAPGTGPVGQVQGVERVVATSASHAASELFRKRELPDAVVLDVRSPVEAARLVRDDPRSAAIVPEACGLEHGLEVKKANVGNEPELRYRYGIVGSRPASRSGNDTTCLLFSLDDAPGTLFQVLRHFAERGINLKKIQSRPVRGASWDYVFYVEVAGHVTDRPVVTALEAVKGATKYLKILGSFATES